MGPRKVAKLFSEAGETVVSEVRSEIHTLALVPSLFNALDATEEWNSA
jgi:hypothetical protein